MMFRFEVYDREALKLVSNDAGMAWGAVGDMMRRDYTIREILTANAGMPTIRIYLSNNQNPEELL